MKEKTMKRTFAIVLLAVMFAATPTLFGTDLASEGIQLINPGKQSFQNNLRGPLLPATTTSEVYTLMRYRADYDHTYYLGNGAEGDTFAVYFQPGIACSLRWVQQKWYNAGTVQAFVWEANPEWLEAFPDGAVNAATGPRGTVDLSPLGDVIIGPVSSTSSEYGWNYLIDEATMAEAEIYLEDGRGFLAGFVKTDSLPSPISDYGDKDYCYTWFGGPWMENHGHESPWGMYSSSASLDIALTVGVVFVGNPPPSFLDYSQACNTIDGNRAVEVSVQIIDALSEWTTEDHAWLVWRSVDSQDNVLAFDSVEIFDEDYNEYFAGEIPAMNLALGSKVYYWFTCLDDGGGYSSSEHVGLNFSILPPAAENKVVLWMDEYDFYGTEPHAGLQAIEKALEEWGLYDITEFYDIDANNGFDDALINQKDWYGILYTGVGGVGMPMVAGDENPFETYLANGGNLAYSDPDYFFARSDLFGSGDYPTMFSAGDFVFDVFGIVGCNNDPEESGVANADTFFVGVSGTISEAFETDPYIIYPHTLGGCEWNDPLYPADEVNGPVFYGSNDDEVYGVMNTTTGDGLALYVSFEMGLAAQDTSGDDTGIVPDEALSDLLAEIYAWFIPFDAVPPAISSLPTSYALHPNYPNPFNPSTEIRFAVPVRSQVGVVVYNLMGQRVFTLVDEIMNAGEHKVLFDASDLPSGVYLCRMNSGSFARTQKMILVK